MPGSLVSKREQNKGLDSFKQCWAIFASVQTDSNGVWGAEPDPC